MAGAPEIMDGDARGLNAFWSDRGRLDARPNLRPGMARARREEIT